MRTLLLVRHGETDWNREGRFQGHTDVALNEAGRAQARAVAERLRTRGVHAVASSDLARARETAEIIAAACELPLACVEPMLRERSYGCFEGLTRDECAARFPDDWSALVQTRRDPPGAERFADVGARLTSAVSRVIETHASVGASLVIVSHGGAIRAFLEATCGTHVPPVPNTAIYEVLYDGRFRDPRLL